MDLSLTFNPSPDVSNVRPARAERDWEAQRTVLGLAQLRVAACGAGFQGYCVPPMHAGISMLAGPVSGP
jgi:hypothetical protein